MMTLIIVESCWAYMGALCYNDVLSTAIAPTLMLLLTLALHLPLGNSLALPLALGCSLTPSQILVCSAGSSLPPMPCKLQKVTTQIHSKVRFLPSWWQLLLQFLGNDIQRWNYLLRQLVQHNNCHQSQIQLLHYSSLLLIWNNPVKNPFGKSGFQTL